MSLALATSNGAPAESGHAEALPLDVKGLTVSYGQKPAIFSVDMSVSQGTMTAICYLKYITQKN